MNQCLDRFLLVVAGIFSVWTSVLGMEWLPKKGQTQDAYLSIALKRSRATLAMVVATCMHRGAQFRFHQSLDGCISRLWLIIPMNGEIMNIPTNPSSQTPSGFRYGMNRVETGRVLNARMIYSSTLMLW